ncbi:MAG: toxin-antitoxin (TA) system antitoxin [Bacteroidota bacterium]
MKVSLHEAQERLGALLEQAAQGDDLVIETGDGATYRIQVTVPEPTPPKKRVAGLHKGAVLYMADDFDEPLPDSFWLGDEDTDPLYQ